MNQIGTDEILYQLSLYQGRREVLVKDQHQNFENIAYAMVKWHNRFKTEYDKICEDFRGWTVEDTSENIWNFLKENSRYVVEKGIAQTLRGPAAMVETMKSWGIDCKNYALFTGGVIDGLNRKGYGVPWCYRFGSYDITDPIPAHVFVVLFPGKDEIWVDPVLGRWNQKKHPFYFQDRTMAVYGISGINSNSRLGRALAGCYLGDGEDDSGDDGGFDFSSAATSAASSSGADISDNPSGDAVALTPTQAGNFDETASGTYQATNPDGTLLTSGPADSSQSSSFWNSVGSALSSVLGGGSGSGAASSAAGAAASLLNPKNTSTSGSTTTTGTGVSTAVTPLNYTGVWIILGVVAVGGYGIYKIVESHHKKRR